MNEDQVNKRLKAAVNSVEVPPFLEARIRRQIQDQAAAPPRRRWMGLAVAATAATLVFGVTYQLAKIRQTSADQESFITTVSSRVATLMRVGLGDHLHCAFFRKFPAEAPAAEEMESELSSEYKELIPVVREHVPQEYTLVLGHQCRYNGRQFVHLSLKGQSLISLVITAKRPGESFDVEGILPGLIQSGVRVYDSNAGQFQIAAMETTNYLVYFISDLPAKQNMQLMQSMVASLKAVLESDKA